MYLILEKREKMKESGVLDSQSCSSMLTSLPSGRTHQLAHMEMVRGIDGVGAACDKCSDSIIWLPSTQD